MGTCFFALRSPCGSAKTGTAVLRRPLKTTSSTSRKQHVAAKPITTPKGQIALARPARFQITDPADARIVLAMPKTTPANALARVNSLRKPEPAPRPSPTWCTLPTRGEHAQPNQTAHGDHIRELRDAAVLLTVRGPHPPGTWNRCLIRDLRRSGRNLPQLVGAHLVAKPQGMHWWNVTSAALTPTAVSRSRTAAHGSFVGREFLRTYLTQLPDIRCSPRCCSRRRDRACSYPGRSRLPWAALRWPIGAHDRAR